MAFGDDKIAPVADEGNNSSLKNISAGDAEAERPGRKKEKSC